jgi:Fur family zinc uptake transcriptional regulator
VTVEPSPHTGKYESMGAFAEHAVQHLKKQGLRITRPRRCVLDLLEETETSLSAYEIRDLLVARGEPIDTVSVYRILDCLEENNLIHRVMASGKVTKCHLEDESNCHLQQQNHCHHLLICQGCGHIEEIHCPNILAMVKELNSFQNFVVTGHNLEFTGFCQSCA